MEITHKSILKKQQYALIGNHSGVKICHWLRQSLLFNRPCYKQSFYGIESHRCLQMSPSINHCNHLCIFCWRYQGFNENNLKKIDDPKYIIEESIKEQKRLITGFKGDDRCDILKWKEANKPNMVACSLSGEPTLYPRLGEFFDECHKKNLTTFLVSNGTNPKFLQDLHPLPKQLYISIVAPNENLYKKICSPLISNGWNKIIETLEILPSLDTRTVIRNTLINNWNIDNKFMDDYARLIKKANPMFIEPKGYVFVGYSRNRMHLYHMPNHSDVREFGINLSKLLDYNIEMERSDSRVLLLSRDKNTSKIK